MPSALDTLREHYQRRDQAARAWRANGGQVVGYLCDNVPEELILAAGFFPYRLSGDPLAGRAAVEQYVQPFALPFSARNERPAFVEAMLNMLLDGTFEFVDFLIVPHTRKGIQAIYRELSLAGAAQADLRLPELFYLDRAYTPFYVAELFNRDRLLELKARLEEWSGLTITDQALVAAIHTTNESRALLQRVAELRVARPARLSGTDALHVIGSSTFMRKEDHNQLLRRLLAEDVYLPRANTSVRLFVGGSPHDHTQLYEIIESCNATVVSEDHCWGTRLAEFAVDPDVDPFEALADRYHRKPACSIAFPIANTVDACTRRAVAAGVDAAIFFVMRGDTGHVWDTPDEIRALAATGVPALYLKDQPYWTSRPDELRATVERFVQSLPPTDGGFGVSDERLESVNAIRAHQRAWLADARQRALDGEPFVICNSDELEEILAVFDIPVLVINYWNFVITAQRKAAHFSTVLEERGYAGPHFFGLGLGATFEPHDAPWGGLPKPTLIVGSTRHESELKVTELWARELGCPCYPLDFNFASPYRRLPGADWWARIRDDWPHLVDPARLALRVEENKALINYLEMLTGRSFSFSKLRRVMDLVNEQMTYMSRARDLIAAARPCPVSLRDQLSAYQTNWHRGTPRGLELAIAYHAEVKERVDSGRGAYATERRRLLYWSMDREPDFHAYLEQQFGAVIVGSPYGAMPQTYARTIYDGDALRTLSARHIFLFDMQSPSWMLREAQLCGVDAVVGVESPSVYPSVFRQASEAAAIPYVAVPRVTADDEIQTLLRDFVETRLASSGER